jgi:hypothetical protein
MAGTIRSEHRQNKSQKQDAEYTQQAGTKELKKQFPVLLRVVSFTWCIDLLSHGGKDFTTWLAA